ncbi:MAG: hypothetical protein QM783_21135 [Phycisphaerales bacterium]
MKKSLEKKTPAFLQNEKMEMEENVRELKKDIEDWKNFTVNDITNDFDYSYSRVISNKLKGRIFSQNGTPIIAFQRIDRGIRTNSRILASSTEFKIYFEYTHNRNLVFYDDIYLGKIINDSVLFNSSDIKIGSYDRYASGDPYRYSIEFDSKKVAAVNKNTDRKNFVNNPFYKHNTRNRFRRQRKIFRETPPTYPLIDANGELDGEELKWTIAIGIFEAVYHGFDFTT